MAKGSMILTVLRNPNLTPTAKLVWIFLRYCASKYQAWYVDLPEIVMSIDDIAASLGVSNSTVRRAIKALVSKRYLPKKNWGNLLKGDGR